ncbi:MAG TPA: hypothetical protein VFM29_03865 [Vicinamibacteria bacterium]|nr:hypothetical protein [Vicinamibacteria bacterium]
MSLVLAALALSAVAPAAAQPAPTPPAPVPVAAPRAAEFAAVLRRAPAFAATTGRAIDPAMTGLANPDLGDAFWIVEFSYTEKGVSKPGVAMIIDVAEFAKKQPGAEKEITVRDGRWGLGGLFEDTTFAGWIAKMQDARRAANEAAAIGDIRTVLSAEFAYSASAGGFGDPACLASPANCIPGYKGLSFLMDGWSPVGDRYGFRRTFHAGPKAAAKTRATPTLDTFAITAVPLVPGMRAFCGDSTGSVCAIADGTMPAITAGACPATCKPLQ